MNTTKKLFIWFFPFLLLIVIALPSFAVEVAPRISDREIIESLAELKVSLKHLEKSIDQRFKALEKSIDARFESIDNRFESFEKRFSFLENLMMVLIAGVFGLIGFVVWDRKTALRPLEKKLDKLEQDLQHDLELQSPEGSRLTRLIHVLRETAKDDQKLAETMRGFSLL